MEILLNLVLCIVVSTVVILAIKFYTSKDKRHADKTAGEKFANQIANGINTSITNMIANTRTPEVIKNELIAKIKTAKDKLKSDFRQYLTDLLTTISTHEKLISNNKPRLATLKQKAKEYKSLFIENNDEKYKTYANKIISQIIQLEKLIATSEQIIIDCKSQKEDAEINYDLLVGELETKHAEIISMTMNPETSLKLSTIDINDLTVEFKDKLTQRNIQIEVSDIVNKTSESENNISNEDVLKYFEQL